MFISCKKGKKWHPKKSGLPPLQRGKCCKHKALQSLGTAFALLLDPPGVQSFTSEIACRISMSGENSCHHLAITHDGSMVLLYMVTWIPSIYPIHVSIYIPAPWILWDMDGWEIRHQLATMGFQWNTVFIMFFFEGIDHLPIGDFATMHSRISIYTVSTNPMLNAYFPNSYNNLGYSLFLHTPRWPECLGWAEGICINHYKSMVFLLDGMLDEHMDIRIQNTCYFQKTGTHDFPGLSFAVPKLETNALSPKKG